MVALSDTLALVRPQYSVNEWTPNITGYYSIKLAGNYFEYQGAGKAWSLSSKDGDAIRFELRDGDQAAWDKAAGTGSERSELASRADVAHIGEAIEVSYTFNLSEGAKNTAKWLTLGQLHQNLEDVDAKAGPPVAIVMQGDDRLAVVIHFTDPATGKMVAQTLWTDKNEIVRGVDHTFDIKTIADPTGQNSRLVVKIDGNTVVDYNGRIGDTAMTGMYWAEGLYRQGDATETQVATYSKLKITTGDAVTFPAPSAFIAAPTLGSNAIAATAKGYDVTFTGTGKAGTTVTLYEGAKAVGSAKVDAVGNVTVIVKDVQAGTHAFHAIASDTTGHSGVASADLDVIVGTATQTGKLLPTLTRDASLSMIHVSDGNMLDVGTVSDVLAVLGSPKLKAALDSDIFLRGTNVVTGKAYDKEVQTYTKDGVLIETQRYSGSKLVYDSVVSGTTTRTATYAADGTANYAVAVGGKTTLTETFSASGKMATRIAIAADGSKESDSYAADGSLAAASLTKADGTRVTVSFGITGRDYVQQASTYDIAGKQLLTGRYDAAGRVVGIVDAVKNATTTFTYDGAAKIATARIAQADATYSVTTYATSGATTQYFNARNVLVATDHKDPAAGLAASVASLPASVSPGAQATLAAQFPAPDYHSSTPTTSVYATTVAANSAAVAAAAATALAAADAAAAATVALATGTKLPVIAQPVTVVVPTPVITTPVATTPTTPSSLAAPTLSLDGLAAAAAGQTVTIKATAAAGSTVKLLDGATVVASGVADATGKVSLSVVAGSGTHAYTATAAASGGATSVASAKLDVHVGTAADLMTKLPTLALDKSLAAISIGGSQVLDVASSATLMQQIKIYGSTLGKLQDTLQFRVTNAVAGKPYDQESFVYDTAGRMIQSERTAGGAAVQTQVFHDNATVAVQWQTGGTRAESVDKGGKAYAIQNFDAAGRTTGFRTYFADGAWKSDNYNAATGAIASSTVVEKSGAHVDTAYGVVGRAYVTQVNAYGATGTILYTGQYDAAGHLLTATDTAAKTTTTWQYGASGAATSARLVKADGSYSVTSFAADGTTVQKTMWYGATGALLKQDASNPATAGTTVATLVAASNAHASYADNLVGGAGANVLKAGDGGAILYGLGGDDTLVGGAGNDIIVGGTGKDVLTGGGGKDLFHFAPGDFASASTAGCDRITDFTQGDRIDLAAFGNAISGHGSFHLIGSAAFGGGAGELRVFDQGGNTFVSGDLNGDKAADFTLQLDGHHALAATDFVF